MTTEETGLDLSSGRVNLIERRPSSKGSSGANAKRDHRRERSGHRSCACPPTLKTPSSCSMLPFPAHHPGLRTSLNVTASTVLGAAGDGPRARRASGGKSRPRSFAPAPLHASARKSLTFIKERYILNAATRGPGIWA
jgi:hypothetical protein